MSRALTSVEVLPVDDRPSEPDGFREFVEARSSALLRSGWLLTGDWPSAEDLVQTALAAAWPRWTSLTRQDAPELYVRKIMVNTFLRSGHAYALYQDNAAHLAGVASLTPPAACSG